MTNSWVAALPISGPPAMTAMTPPTVRWNCPLAMAGMFAADGECTHVTLQNIRHTVTRSGARKE
jgi:hypothetical protein